MAAGLTVVQLHRKVRKTHRTLAQGTPRFASQTIPLSGRHECLHGDMRWSRQRRGRLGQRADDAVELAIDAVARHNAFTGDLVAPLLTEVSALLRVSGDEPRRVRQRLQQLVVNASYVLITSHGVTAVSVTLYEVHADADTNELKTAVAAFAPKEAPDLEPCDNERLTSFVLPNQWMFVDDASEAHDALPSRYRNFAAVPVGTGDYVSGLLTATSSEPGSLDQSDLGELLALAAILSVVDTAASASAVEVSGPRTPPRGARSGPTVSPLGQSFLDGHSSYVDALRSNR